MKDSKQSNDEPLGFMRLSQIIKLIPVSKVTWWNGCKTGKYPKPYKLGPRITAWKTSDIYHCLENFKVTKEEN
ncbi:AlpA family transcriptional regulator [Emticicia sp. C21]|uniref:helix-turn-helix transcriptional regulator n=1 Tax=Emticicia sp. C21 TaxID=2302915 RepID=UPI000E35769F|nr:AlpA family phage regulatory protein [Emticicia sp. C21]RFS13313.1 AlpA family phage regulatory protein [Emticicia sp. C21]